MKNLTIFFFFLIVCGSTIIGQTGCDRMADSLQLVALHDSTDGPNWNDPWDLSMPMNTWYGIQLTPDGCVKKISAWAQDMDGNLPVLDLPFLEWLDINGSRLEGVIPDLKLPSLIFFDGSFNEFDGLTPNFSHMPNLEELNLSNNYSLSFQNFTHFPNLVNLNMSDCLASIPSYDSLPSLEYVNVAGNSGFVMPSLASSTKMKEIRASWTSYEQPVPDYSHMPHLYHLELRASSTGLWSLSTGSFANPSGFPSLTYLAVDGGAFTFDDLLPFVNVNTFIYAPQYEIEMPLHSYALVGDMVELHVPVDSFVSNNVYEWHNGGQLASTTTTNSYWISSAAKSDSGEYVTTITNASLPDLTLETRPYQLHVYDSLSIISVQPNTQQNIQAGAQTPLINMSFSPNQPQGMQVFYVMTDTLGNVLKTANGSWLDINSSTAGSFRGYGVLSLQTAAPQIGDNIFAMDDSLARFKVSENFMPIQVGSATSLESAFDAGLQLMPNPTNDVLRLRIPESLPVPPAGWAIDIMTLEGQLIHQEAERFNSSIELDVADYPKGVYLLRLRNQEQQWNMRWVKE